MTADVYERQRPFRFHSVRERRRIGGQIFAVSSLPEACMVGSGLIKAAGVSGKSREDRKKRRDRARKGERRRKRARADGRTWCTRLSCHSRGGCSCGRSVRARDSSFHLRVARRDVSVRRAEPSRAGPRR